jgi:hypothetical protein
MNALFLVEFYLCTHSSLDVLLPGAIKRKSQVSLRNVMSNQHIYY